MDQSLAHLVRSGMVTYEECFSKTKDRHEFQTLLDQVHKHEGQTAPGRISRSAGSSL